MFGSELVIPILKGNQTSKSGASFGQITQVIDNNQRIIQLGVKVLF